MDGMIATGRKVKGATKGKRGISFGLRFGLGTQKGVRPNPGGSGATYKRGELGDFWMWEN